MLEDKRIFSRFARQIPLRFLESQSGKEGQAQTQDISAKGLGFICEEKLYPFSALEMWLEIQDKGEPLYLRGAVIWSKQVDQDKYRIGIELEKAELMGLARVLRLENGSLQNGNGRLKID